MPVSSSENCPADELSTEQNFMMDESVQSKEIILEARTAVFLTACHEGRWSVAEEQYQNDSDTPDISDEVKQLSDIYAEANKKLKRIYELWVQETTEACKLEEVRVMAQPPFSALIENYSENLNVHKIRDLLSSLVSSKKRNLEIISASLRDEQILHDQLSAKLTKLRTRSKSNAQDPNEKQTTLFQKWMNQRLGTISRHDSTHATLRLGSTLPKRQRNLPLIRGLIKRGTFGSQMLTDLQVVFNSNDIVDLAHLSSNSLCPSILVASILLHMRLDDAIAQDLNRLSSRYPLDWDRSNRLLHLLTGQGGAVMATIRIAPNGQPSLVQIRHSSTADNRKCERTDDVQDYIPPLPWSLDEWLMDISDYCNSNSLKTE